MSLVESEVKAGGWVDCSFCFSCFNCPFDVLMVGIKFILTISSVNPSHVAN